MSSTNAGTTDLSYLPHRYGNAWWLYQLTRHKPDCLFLMPGGGGGPKASIQPHKYSAGKVEVQDVCSNGQNARGAGPLVFVGPVKSSCRPHQKLVQRGDCNEAAHKCIRETAQAQRRHACSSSSTASATPLAAADFFLRFDPRSFSIAFSTDS